ncbi:LacI family transcriptional regulator (plasmid) [Rhizobium sp. RCAM05350]|nr:LacI family transcriptional regulator [Rhizobium sp. RCAM05350]
MQRRRPTIIDVAQKAGVSKSTAGRALSGASNVTDEARERVLDAARAVGYERNDLAVGMRSGRTGLLGLVIPDITNPFWAEVARGAGSCGRKRHVAAGLFIRLGSRPRGQSSARCGRRASTVRSSIRSPIISMISTGLGYPSC